MKPFCSRRNRIALPLFILIISISNYLSAQTAVKNARLSRASFLSKKYKLTSVESTSLVQALDSLTQSMNKIFHDSVLTSAEKRKRLELLEKEKADKIKQIVPDKANLLFVPVDQRQKMSN